MDYVEENEWTKPQSLAYDRGVGWAKATVKDWHPKCETCEWKETDETDGRTYCGRHYQFRAPTDYCNLHTALRGED